MTTATLPVLTDGICELRPIANSEDFDYLFQLMPKYKYNVTLGAGDAREVTMKYGRHFWVGGQKGRDRCGVIYLQHFPDMNIWSLDAYRDELTMPKEDISFRAGELVMNWFFDNYFQDLHTVHDSRHRAATRVCQRLGFKIEKQIWTDIGRFVIMVKKPEGILHG